MKRLGLFITLIFTPYLLTLVCISQETNTLPGGLKCIGEWKGGQPNGQETLIETNGAKYVGDVKNGE